MRICLWSTPILWGFVCKCVHCQKSTNCKSVSDLLCPSQVLSATISQNTLHTSSLSVWLHFPGKFISMQTTEPGKVLLPFDVISLSTSVLTKLACQLAEEQLSTDYSLGEHIRLTPVQFLSLLRVCLNRHLGMQWPCMCLQQRPIWSWRMWNKLLCSILEMLCGWHLYSSPTHSIATLLLQSSQTFFQKLVVYVSEEKLLEALINNGF